MFYVKQNHPDDDVATLQPKSHPKGFALIIALTLMSFLFLLLISLSTLVNVETKTSTIEMQTQMARQNALLGLQVALGHLQEYAGPDQRVTTTASIFDSTPDTHDIDELTSGGGNIENPYWVGVWDAESPSNMPVDFEELSELSGEDAEYYDYGNRRTDKLMTWLVSGVHDSNLVDPSNQNELRDFALSGSPPDLVKVFSGASNDPANLTEVMVPKVEVSTGDLMNHYAYWISDEGVKAKLNVASENFTSTAADDKRIAFANNQASGINTLSEFADFQHDNSLLERLNHYSDMAIPESLSNIDYSDYFHDVTLFSQGILTDTKNGGLRRDLTSLLSIDSDVLFGQSIVEAGIGFTSVENNELRIAEYPHYAVANKSSGKNTLEHRAKQAPTWKKLRSYYQLKDDSGDGVIDDQLTSDIQHGINPVVVRSVANFYPILEQKLTIYEFSSYMSFQVALWNPYNVAIQTEAYDLVFFLNERNASLKPGFFGKDVRKRWVGGSGTTYLQQKSNPSTPHEEVKYLKNIFHSDNVMVKRLTEDGDSMNCRGFVFTVPATRFEPGEVLNFSISDVEHLSDYRHGVGLSNINNSDNAVKFKNPFTLSPSDLFVNGTGNEDDMYGFQWFVIFQDREGDTSSSETARHPHNDIRIDSDTRQSWGPGGVGILGLAENGSTTSAGDFLDEDSFYYRVTQLVYTHWSPAVKHVSGNASKLKRLKISSAPDRDIFTDPALIKSYIVQADTAGDDETWQVDFASSNTFSNNAKETKPFSAVNLRAPHQTVAGFRSSNRDYVDRAGKQNFGWWGTQDFKRGVSKSDFYQFDLNPGNESRGYFGPGFKAADEMSEFALFDVPRPETSILSIGALQHADFSNNQLEPTYAVGNSLPDLLITNLEAVSRPTTLEMPTDRYEFYSYNAVDVSYILNDALWDGFFFSGIESLPGGGAGSVSKNSRYLLTGLNNAGTLPFTSVASDIRVSGAFNINSTSVNAWKALLGGGNGLSFDPVASGGGRSLKNPFSRTAFPGADSKVGDIDNRWRGFRELTGHADNPNDNQLNDLAEAIVSEVKNRGPFLSLSDFVNRRRVVADEGRKGALQAAIDSAGINSEFLNEEDREVADIWGTGQINGFLVNSGGGSEMVSGYLSQADILQAVGSHISARSDTFLVRSYGDVTDPLSGAVTSTVYCEAVVQRVPEFVDDNQRAADTPVRVLDPATERFIENVGLSNVNAQFGRRFKIVSFRWLSESEI